MQFLSRLLSVALLLSLLWGASYSTTIAASESVDKTKKTIEILLDAHSNPVAKTVCKSELQIGKIESAKIDAWIADLADENHAVREQGQACLKKYLATNASQIHSAIKSKLKTGSDLEQRYRLEQLNSNIGEAITCSISKSKVSFYSGDQKLPGLLKKVTTPQAVRSQDFPTLNLGKCVSPETAMRLRDFKWDKMTDPWDMTVARELASVVLPDPKLGVRGPAWLSEIERFRFLHPSRGSFTAHCTGKPDSKCDLNSPLGLDKAPAFRCRYACNCGTEKAVEQYEVSALVDNTVAGAASLSTFDDEEICPSLCKAEGKQPAPSTVRIPSSSPSGACLEDAGKVDDHKKIVVTYSLSGKFEEEKGVAHEADEPAGIELQKTLKRVTEPSH